MFDLRAIKILLGASCITIFGNFVAVSSSADSIEGCMAEVCRTSTTLASLSAFLGLEKSEHPGLTELYGRFQARIDRIRIAREKQVRESLLLLGNKQATTDSIRRLSDQDLMSLFFERQPWNFKTGSVGGRFVVIADPLMQDQRQREAVIQIFSRMQAASPMYAGQLQVLQLNADPKFSLHVPNDQQIESFILDSIKKQIGQMPIANQAELLQELMQMHARVAKFKEQYGDKIYASFGAFELGLKIKLGHVPFLGSERSLVESIMIDDVAHVVETRKVDQAAIDKVYAATTWEKTCRGAYNRALHYGLTQAEKDRVEKQLKPEALRRSIETVKGLFGPSLTSEIVRYVQTLEIGGPMSLPEYINYVEQNLIEASNLSNKTELTLLEKFNLIKRVGSGKDEALENLCNSFIFDPIRDQVTGKNVILSAYSAKNYYVGLSIAIHEMGHVVSIALDSLKKRGVSIAPFEQIRECISTNYAGVDRKASYDHSQFDADKLWTEEDWADAFSGHSTSDLSVNNMCGFLGVLPENDFVEINKRFNDPHSPTFYRILNINTHLKRNLPNQCQKPLETQFSGTKFKDCISSYSR